MSPGLVDWPKSPMIFFTNLGRAVIIPIYNQDKSEKSPKVMILVKFR